MAVVLLIRLASLSINIDLILFQLFVIKLNKRRANLYIKEVQVTLQKLYHVALSNLYICLTLHVINNILRIEWRCSSLREGARFHKSFSTFSDIYFSGGSKSSQKVLFMLNLETVLHTIVQGSFKFSEISALLWWCWKKHFKILKTVHLSSLSFRLLFLRSPKSVGQAMFSTRVKQLLYLLQKYSSNFKKVGWLSCLAVLIWDFQSKIFSILPFLGWTTGFMLPAFSIVWDRGKSLLLKLIQRWALWNG